MARSRSRPSAEPGLRLLVADLLRWRGAAFERRAALALALLAVVAAVVTYMELSAQPPYGTGIRRVLLLLNLDLVLLLLLGVIVARRVVRILLERRRGRSGSRLHARLVALFSVIAILPSMTVAIFSAAFLSSGLEAWFSGRISTALDNSLKIARAYLEEHKANIRADALAMAADLSRDLPFYLDRPRALQRLVDAQAALRALGEAVVFDAGGRVLARSGLSFTLEIAQLPLALLERADQGEVVVLTTETEDRVRALVRIEGLGGLYLVIGRFVDPEVLARVAESETVVAEYQAMQRERSDIQIASALIFGVVALLMLLAAVWAGLVFADRLATPLVQLVAAAERIGQGDLAARVPEGRGEDEIDILCRTFNRMADQIATQQRELLEANRMLDSRRRFTEAVVTGVSAGVIGLHADRRIALLNPPARAFLGCGDGPAPQGQPVAACFPEIVPLLEELHSGRRRIERQLRVLREGRHHILLVRVTLQWEEEGTGGYVVTFDDVTELITAQRQAAWAEVARRIAHEIKNPLTPIRLSAERLGRKFAGQIGEGREAFEKAVATIVRQVDTIGRLIAEFSAFARMPQAVLQQEALDELVEQAVVLERTAWPKIRFDLDIQAERPLLVLCDGGKITQALANLLKNAAEAVSEARPAQPRVEVRLKAHGDLVEIEVEDNGTGLPEGDPHRLFEPYVTTKGRGSGLGLAIVRKIMEEHEGRVELCRRPGGGAVARLSFPRRAGSMGA